jgi:type I restriction enzyme S subunit
MPKTVNQTQMYRFDEIAVLVKDKIDNPAEADVDRYVGLEHLDPESLKIRRWGVPTDVEASKLVFKSGDIIFGKRRVYQRKLAVADFDGICSAHAMVLRARPDVVLPEFLPFFMQSDWFMERALEISVGSLSPTINWKTLAKQEFSLPTLEEQRRIAEALQQAGALTEKLILLQESVYRTLSSAASLKFSVLGDRYPVVRLSAICLRKPQSGIYKPEEYRGHGTPMVNMGELFGNDVIDTEIDMGRVQLDEAELLRYRLTPNDLLFGRRSVVLEGAGRCVLVRDPGKAMVFESSVLRATIDPKKADARFIFEWLRSPLGHQQIRRIVTFTTVSGVAGSEVARLPVPLPPLEVQRCIANELGAIRDQQRVLRDRIEQSKQFSRAVAHRVLEES